jgi:putative membrane protein
MRRVAVFSIAVPLALLAGCGGGGGGGGAAVQSASASSAAIAPVMLSAASYVAMASSIDLYQVKSAQLALERSHDPANRSFAQRALNAHQGTSAQLSMAGRRLNILPSATLDPEHQAMLDALNATSDFDHTYRAQQNMVLQEALRLHSGFARNGQSPTLRPVAANAESVMRANLQALRNSQ